MKNFYILVLILVCSSFNISYSDDIKVNDILMKMEKIDKNIQDMEFNFTQEIDYISTDEKQISSGAVKHKKPNYIYMYQKNPNEQYTYIDGKKITIYVPANKQAIVESWKDVLNSDIILTTIIGFSKNFRTFEKDHSIILESQNDKEYTLLMKSNNPKQTWQMYINVDKETLLVNGAVFDNKNFVIKVKLTDYKLNVGLQTDIFKFKSTKDIDVIEL
ncbi:MAG: outer-membrane lipoprotein carrier protein LolA [Endomicrobiia bacterium]|jgi:chaperone LolA|nr:outer-membrane lipoprotein carrier protein LolA [Endomicrobiaceae bacterium]MDD3922501.1 outer-membrane lipoprotein carrier protein LolA [Endomicrobiaceae bacterium]MDD5102437.1 outer-membrane lipoprotein carrier protein LolA [Endomicrobiaceae bacterium]